MNFYRDIDIQKKSQLFFSLRKSILKIHFEFQWDFRRLVRAKGLRLVRAKQGNPRKSH